MTEAHHSPEHQPLGQGPMAPLDRALPTDPICGMTVDPETAAGSHTHAGTTYWFCSPGCLDRFRTQPDAYLAPIERPAPLPVAAGRVWTCPMHPETTLGVDLASPITLADRQAALLDGGAHWTRVGKGLTNMAAVTVNPKRPAEIYAVTVDGAISRSTDNGITWHRPR